MLKNEFERESVCIKLVISWICKVREMRSEELRFLGFFVFCLSCGMDVDVMKEKELRKEQSWGKFFWVYLFVYV